MMRMRPVREQDLDGLVSLAKSTGTGLTTLPDNRAVLAERINASLAAFQDHAPLSQSDSYLMVLEDMTSGKIAGTSAIFTGVGLLKGFYNYKILTMTQTSKDLKAVVHSKLLHLVNDYAGATEVGTLYLDPHYRGGGNGKLLARSRYLLMAQFPERFAELVMAEMRGWQDGDGRSPFWENLGKHFFGIGFAEADYISGIGNNQFIADLMPKYPIYVDLLPKEAQEVIGKTHDQTRPALELLLKEGFRFSNAVDIFDGGPCVDVRRDDIRTVKDSRLAHITKLLDDETGLERRLCCTTSMKNYQAFYAPIKIVEEGSVEILRSTAETLGLGLGDQLRQVEA